jgi:hypothetical protein
MRFRARNTGWLAIISAMMGLAALTPGADPAGVGILAALFGVTAFATLVEFRPGRLVQRSRSSLTALRVSGEAREAVERARRRGSSLHSSILLLDVGLIAAQTGPDGLVMQRERNLSKDDDGARPFAVLHVPAEDADRRSIIRFELIDQNGELQYVHEMNTYLRDGEMNLLPDRQMPLYDNARLLAGEWDLRVYVDNRLIGAHMFNVAPSLDDRFPRAARDRAAQRLADREQPSEETMLRLEDLLRDQSRQRRER